MSVMRHPTDVNQAEVAVALAAYTAWALLVAYVIGVFG